MHSILNWNEAGACMMMNVKAATSWPLEYASNDVFPLAIQMLLAVIFICWLASVITHNYSHVDRAWSIVPGVYVWHFAIHAWLRDGQWNERLLLQSVLVTAWGLRLTYNFWRKGGYRLSEEDYRWGVLRTLMLPVIYQIFNVVFIAGYQNLLMFLMILPVYPAYLYRSTPLQHLDVIAALLFISLLVLETVADEQQWVYYQTKYELVAKKELLTGDYKVGFNRSGLFAYSRHPNFFAEQFQWCVFYLFSVSSTGIVWNATAIGAILLILLFQGSTAFTESITAKKYPAYKAYQQTVSRQIPWFPTTAKERMD